MYLPILGNPQLEFPHPGHQTPAVITGAVTQPPRTPLAFFSPKDVSHLLSQDLLEHFPQELFQTVFVGAKNLLQVDPAPLH